ncbi:hypothetical protein [Caulobacter sp. LARHSG274]
MTTLVKSNLTGIWQGLYSYPRRLKPVTFTATLIESGAWLSGSVHETAQDQWGDWLEVCATLLGKRAERTVGFTKTYDGENGWNHSVVYDGVLSNDATEIEGRWSTPEWSGRFLMIRPEGRRVRALNAIFARV